MLPYVQTARLLTPLIAAASSLPIRIAVDPESMMAIPAVMDTVVPSTAMPVSPTAQYLQAEGTSLPQSACWHLELVKRPGKSGQLRSLSSPPSLVHSLSQQVRKLCCWCRLASHGFDCCISNISRSDNCKMAGIRVADAGQVGYAAPVAGFVYSSKGDVPCL